MAELRPSVSDLLSICKLLPLQELQLCRSLPLAALLKGEYDGGITDATALVICDNKRSPRYKVFKGLTVR